MLPLDLEYDRTRPRGHQRPHVDIEINKGNYILKTVSTFEEFQWMMKLRYDVFHREFQEKTDELGSDFDHYDADSDHLIIIDKTSASVIGCYRVRCSRFHQSFYSESEFNIEQFLMQSEVKLELGRACVHLAHRNGTVISILWRGIREYMQKTNSTILFGCSSIKSTCAHETMNLILRLQQMDVLSNQFLINPVGKYRFVEFDSLLTSYLANGYNPRNERASVEIPSLVSSYLKMGGKVHGLPAIDRDFSCIDLFTTLNLQDMNGALAERFRS
jgi:putative hemolysin